MWRWAASVFASAIEATVGMFPPSTPAAFAWNAGPARSSAPSPMWVHSPAASPGPPTARGVASRSTYGEEVPLVVPSWVICRPVALAGVDLDPGRVVDVREGGVALPGVRRVPWAGLAEWVAERPANAVLLGEDDLDSAAAAERCAALGLGDVGWVAGGLDGWRAAGRPTVEAACDR